MVDPTQEKLEWFKLLLQPDNNKAGKESRVHKTRELLASINKTPEDVATDYLRFIWDYTSEQLRLRKGDLSMFDVKVVLTVPAIWNDFARNKIIDIAIKAGLRVTSLLSLSLRLPRSPF